MNKIKTIFDRKWKGDRGVVNKIIIKPDGVATEKLDGTNIRLTIRNHVVVRIEKRKNPTKRQKLRNIVDPWYIDADEYAPEDKYIIEAVKNRSYEKIPNGEHSGEAVGPKIQGNPLNLNKHTICLFNCGEAPVFENATVTYNELKKWLPKQKSKF